jgi:alcohol dehydrogenase
MARNRASDLAGVSEFRYPSSRRLLYGPNALDRLPDVLEEIGANRAFAVVSSHLGPVREQLETVLGPLLAGTFDGTAMHVPRQSVVAAAAQAREAAADVVISFGGGTVIDCAKGVTLCLGYGITEPGDLDGHAIRYEHGGRVDVPAVDRELLPHISVPTTLSGAESTRLFGSTDSRTLGKAVFASPRFAVDTILLDPLATRETPAQLWAASGMRAVDHAVEGMLSARHMPLHDGAAVEGLQLLVGNLAKSSRDPDDADARLACQLGAWLAAFAAEAVGTGLSHAIGHQLAPQFDLLHGVTSALMLPHVVAFGRDATVDRLPRVAAGLGVDVTGLSNEQAADAAVEALRRFVATLEPLGVPQSLRAAGCDHSQLGQVADHVMGDPTIATSPLPIDRQAVLGLLEAAWSFDAAA